ncbi:MAG: patatin-like phospholipase family protein [Proteobacteria bacterium]|nr:patatin-like phospholipase family protein [Pseudomonadota bacterium]
MELCWRKVLLLLIVSCSSGCVIVPYGAYTNSPIHSNSMAAEGQTATATQTSFQVRADRHAHTCDGDPHPPTTPKQRSDVLVLLALSGGGSRAAYFAGLSMLEMERFEGSQNGKRIDLLHEVDAISSVSGGSLAAAYYAVSYDPGQECAAPSKKAWTRESVDTLMSRNYIRHWIGNWFRPTNVARYWFTYYDRTDIMAKTFSSNLFDGQFNTDLTMGELNPLRPNLIINATSGTRLRMESGEIGFGEPFAFTDENFKRICSSISDYPIARAVMASATFPGVFNFMTLRYFHEKEYCQNRSPVYSDSERRYLHLFDGGNSDNLGLSSLRRVIWESLKKEDDGKGYIPYSKIVVILVDAFIPSLGANGKKPDPRSGFDFIVDMNFIDATDSLLETNRDRFLAMFSHKELFPFYANGESLAKNDCMWLFRGLDVQNCATPIAKLNQINREVAEKLEFVHIKFDKVPLVQSGCDDPNCLRNQLNRIPTSFKLGDERDSETGLDDHGAIKCAVPALFGRAEDKDARSACGKIVLETGSELVPELARVRTILSSP